MQSKSRIPAAGWKLARLGMIAAALALLIVGRDTPRVEAQPNGTLQITKVLVDAQGQTVNGDLSGYTFTVSGGGSTFTLGPTTTTGVVTGSLAPGNYTATEAQRAGVTFLGTFLNGVQALNFSITAGQTTALVARNQVSGTASITVTKQIVDASNQVITTADRSGFQVAVTGPNAFSTTVTTDANGAASVVNLAAGTYTITETPKTGFQFVAMGINGVASPNPGTVTLTAGQQAQVSLFNRQGATGQTITVQKVIVDASGNQVAAADRSGFQFTIACSTTPAFSQAATTDTSGNATIQGVPTGSCTLTEAARTGFTFRSAGIVGTTTTVTNGGTFTVTTGQNVTFQVQNTQGGGGTTPPGQTEDVPLFAGCNNVATTFPTGTATSTIAAGITPTNSVRAMWLFINAQQRFVGYSPLPGAPNDFLSADRGAAFFICMEGPGTFRRPQI